MSTRPLTPTGGNASTSGTNFWAYQVQVGSGSQQVVAAVRDAAGNVGYATNTVTMRVATNGSYGYSSAGCVTSIVCRGAGFTNSVGLSWNSQYQITSLTTNGVAAESFLYDAYGRRVRSISPGATNFHVYDGIHVIADVNPSGEVVRSYTYGPGIDNLLAMTVHGATTGTYFYIKDHLGTVHAVTDDAGNIIESYRYDAWGRVLGVYNGAGQPLTESAVGNRFLWAGKEYSWPTGLYHNHARFYDPITGRFLSKDPSGINGGLNEFTYCVNSPVSFVDRDGRYVIAVIGEILVGGAILGYILDPWFELSDDPGGATALTRGPLTFYGPEFKCLPEVLKESTRVHEHQHKYHQWGFLPWNILGREIDAYEVEKQWLLARRAQARREGDTDAIKRIDREIKLIRRLFENDCLLLKQTYEIR